jgi:acyl-CoA synthetase (AMP-forming)/AMP-acid ligase II
MNGYWRNEKATQEAFPEGRDDGSGWFRSGDAGYLQDGYLFIQDRIKDMIISGGENIYPIEVENVVMKHPAVRDCAVIAVPDEKWGEAVKACVILQPGMTLSAAELIDFCRAQLAHFKCPRSVDFLDVLPRTPTGKVLKKVLREPYWSGAARKVN